MKILMMDDNELINNLLGRFLKEKNHDVISAVSCANDLSLMEHQKFDVIITNLSLEGCNSENCFEEFEKKELLKKIMLFYLHNVFYLMMIAVSILKEEQKHAW